MGRWLILTALAMCLSHGQTEATEMEVSAEWVTYETVSSLLQNPPPGAVRVGNLYIGRVPHESGLWVGKVQLGGTMYVGLPDGSRLMHFRGTLQVLVTQSDKYKWIKFDASLGLPIPSGTVEGGYTENGTKTYVCVYRGIPGSYVPDTDQCWTELYGVKSGSSSYILVPKEVSAEWVNYESMSSLLQNLPPGAVASGDEYIGRVPHESGLWVGKVHLNGHMYVGFPDGSRVILTGPMQVLVMEQGSYSWSSYDSTQNFPVSVRAVEAGYTDAGEITYVCKHSNIPGTYVPETGRCWTEFHGTQNSTTCEILHRD